MMLNKTLFSKYSIPFIKYMEKSKQLIVIIFDIDLVIEDYNEAFSYVLNAGSNYRGKNLSNILTPDSMDNLKLSLLDEESNLILNFTINNFNNISLNCHIFKDGGHFFLFAEKMIISHDSTLNKMTLLTNELVNKTRELQKKNRSLEEAKDKIKILSGLIPICSSCKNIRNDEGYWMQLEAYINAYSEATFSHGICPECVKKLYPELNDDDN